MTKILYCKNCDWEESELSPSGYASARYHEQLYKHKVIEKEQGRKKQ